jgi:CheY-like chemotaxis protein
MDDEAQHDRDPDGGLRRLFLDAALEILDEPATELELRKVAERAGKSRTAPYLAFGKAEDGGGLPALQMAVAAEGFGALGDRLHEALASASSPEEALEGVAAAYLAFARAHPRLFRHMFGHEVSRALRDEPGDRARSPVARREQFALLERRIGLEAVIQDLVRRQRPGYLRDSGEESPAEVAGALWAMIHGVAVLTIDEQWGLGGLRDEDAAAQAERALRFLTTASHRALARAAEALERAQARRAGGVRGIWGMRGMRASGWALLGSSGEPASEVPAPEVADRRDWVDRAPPPVMREDAAAYSLMEPMPAEPAPPHHPTPRADAQPPVLRRVGARAERLRGVRVLWIDDRPRGVTDERRMLEALGMEVEAVASSQKAFEALDRSEPALVISSVARGGVPDEGIRVLPAIRALAPAARVIFYVPRLPEGEETPVPPGAFGITHDPEELLHLVMDAVERG